MVNLSLRGDNFWKVSKNLLFKLDVIVKIALPWFCTHLRHDKSMEFVQSCTVKQVDTAPF